MGPHFAIDRRALIAEAQRSGMDVTVTGIARALQVAPSTLSRALSGVSVPGEELLARIRVTFGPEGFDRVVTVHYDPADDAAAADAW